MPKFFNKKTATVRFHGFNEEKKYQNSKWILKASTSLQFYYFNSINCCDTCFNFYFNC